MRQMAEHGVAPFLPEETMRNILKRLPVKSLIRFQCVCKNWKNLFKTSSFISDHLHHSSLQKPSLLLKENSGRDPLPLRLIDCEMNVREVQYPPSIGSLTDVRIIGSSYGLLCVAFLEYENPTWSFFNSLLLWNPAIGEIRQISRTRAIDSHERDWKVGFGYSADVNDYKIVKTYAGRDAMISRVEVYSLSTGSWKEIEFGILKGVRLFGDAIAANGAIFWDCGKRVVKGEGEDDVDLIFPFDRAMEEGKDVVDFIVSFDVAKEVFTLIPLPSPSNNSISKLTVYENKFAMLSFSRFGRLPNYLYCFNDLWVLEEGIGSSTEERWIWIEKCTIDSFPSMVDCHVTIWGNEIVCRTFGEPIFAKMENDEEKVGVYLINPITKECKMFPVPGCRLGDGFNYVESLLPVGNIDFEVP